MNDKIKYLIRYLLKKEVCLKSQLKTHIKIYGNRHGSFGVATDYLKKTKNTVRKKGGGGGRKSAVIYSFGIGEDISFEQDIMKQYNVEILAFDPTPKSIQWIEKLELPDNFHFNAFGISNLNGVEKFYLPQNPNYVSGSIKLHDGLRQSSIIEVPMQTLSTIMKGFGHHKIDVLKMDIEGSEFKVIPNILADKIQITQILFEVHDRFWKDGKRRLRDLVKVLNDNNYYLVYVSKSGEELTFIKKKKIKRGSCM